MRKTMWLTLLGLLGFAAGLMGAQQPINLPTHSDTLAGLQLRPYWVFSSPLSSIYSQYSVQSEDGTPQLEDMFVDPHGCLRVFNAKYDSVKKRCTGTLVSVYFDEAPSTMTCRYHHHGHLYTIRCSYRAYSNAADEGTSGGRFY